MKKRFVLVLGLVLGSNVYAIPCPMPADQEVGFEQDFEYYKSINDNKAFNEAVGRYKDYGKWWYMGTAPSSIYNNDYDYEEHMFACNLKYEIYNEVKGYYYYKSMGIGKEAMKEVRKTYSDRYNRYLNERYLKNISN